MLYIHKPLKRVLRTGDENLPACGEESRTRFLSGSGIQLRGKVVKEQNGLSPELKLDQPPRPQDEGQHQPPFLSPAQGLSRRASKRGDFKVVTVRAHEGPLGVPFPLGSLLKRAEKTLLPASVLKFRRHGERKGQGGTDISGILKFKEKRSHAAPRLHDPAPEAGKRQCGPADRSVLSQEGGTVAGDLMELGKAAGIRRKTKGTEPV